jgi:hypothetical protein
MANRTVEDRLSELEAKVARLLGEETQNVPWWEQWIGAFKENPDFDAAMERGADYRRSQPTAADEMRDKADDNNVPA